MSGSQSVLFIAHTGQVSGAEKVLLNLIREALGTGYRVSLACPPGPLTNMLPIEVTHVPIPPLGLGGERGVARALSAARLLMRWWRAGRRLALLVRKPGNHTVVNSLFALPAVRVARPPGGAAWLVHDTVTSVKQRVVITISRSAIRTAVALSHASAVPLEAMGVPVRVTHQGVRWPVPRLAGELHSPPVIGMLALLTPWKGHRVLLDAVASLPDVQVELAGGSFPSDQNYVDDLRERASRTQLAGRVHFLGHVSSEAALARWDVVVSASVNPEAAPLSVLEAMSHGVPVVGTNHGGTVEFLADGRGLLVPPNDPTALAQAIKTILSNGQLRAEVTNAARSRIAQLHDISVTLPTTLRALLIYPDVSGGRTTSYKGRS